jgi:glycosyltransferase involved in cell wall biosynthesis
MHAERPQLLFPAPRTSIIMPVRDGARFIAEAICSIAAQSLPVDEIVVVDDGSTDRSAELALAAAPHLVRLHRQPPLGVGQARLTGLTLARGDWVRFFDADDVMPPTAMAALHRTVRAAEAEAAWGAWRNFWQAEQAHEAADPANAHLLPVQHTPQLIAGLFSRPLIDRTELIFRDDGLYSSAIWARLLEAAARRTARTDVIVVERRIHDRNISRRKTAASLLDLALMLQRSRRLRTTPQNEK